MPKNPIQYAFLCCAGKLGDQEWLNEWITCAGGQGFLATGDECGLVAVAPPTCWTTIQVSTVNPLQETIKKKYTVSKKYTLFSVDRHNIINHYHARNISSRNSM